MSKLPIHWDPMHALGAYISPDTTNRLCYVQSELQKIFNLVTDGKITEFGVKIRAINIAKVLNGLQNDDDAMYEEALQDFCEKEYSHNSPLLGNAKYTDVELSILEDLLIGYDDDESLD